MRLCMEGGCAEGSSAEEKVEDVMGKVMYLRCRHAEERKWESTQASSSGVIESHNSVRSATRRGGYLSEPEGNETHLS